MQLPSEESLILDDLKQMKHDKWGYVIYRCTYKDDAAWDRLKHIVHEHTRKKLRNSDTSELLESLEWTFVEDRATLDAASIPQLRERFNQWAAKAVVAENPRAEAQTQDARYCCFIHVDEEALQSVTIAPERRKSHGEPGYVNFVDPLWEPFGDRYFEDGYEPDESEILEPVDGCVEANVGWMRVGARMAFSANFTSGLVMMLVEAVSQDFSRGSIAALALLAMGCWYAWWCWYISARTAPREMPGK